MGRIANMSPMGLYNWDSTVFDLMQIPAALNKDTLINNLLAETAELEVLYPNPVVFKNLVGVWSAKQIDIWNRLYATTQYEYDPIENYNRYETGSNNDTDNTTHTGTGNRTSSLTNGGKDTNTGGSWIAGFNSTPVSAEDDGLVKQTRDQAETAYGKTENIQETRTYEEQTATEKEGEHNIHAHGNIGITTTQQLITEQRSIDLFNIYDIIIEDFKMRFCILVY